MTTSTNVFNIVNRAGVTVKFLRWTHAGPELSAKPASAITPDRTAFLARFKYALTYRVLLPQFESTSNILFRMEVGRRGSRYPMLFALFISLKCALELCEDAMTNLGVTP